MITLYHNDMSACAQKVRFALAEKKLDWLSIELNLRAGEQQHPDYLKINPKGLVPALVHNASVVVESNIILDYINEAFPEPPLLPEHPLERARVRWWMKRLDDGLHLDLAALSFGLAFRHQLKAACGSDDAVRKHIDAVPDPYLREVERQVVDLGVHSPRFAMALAQFDHLLEDLEKELSQRVWLGGDTLGLADIAYAPYATRLDHLQLSPLWDHRPAFSDWYTRLRANEGYQLALAKWFNQDYLLLMREQGRAQKPLIASMMAELSHA